MLYLPPVTLLIYHIYMYNMTPSNQRLYSKVKKRAMEKFSRYPSIYASSWIVREYKKLGGTYKDSKKTSSETGLSRWYNEQWIQVIPFLTKNEKIVCGNNNKDGKACRPLLRKSKETPITINELLKIHSKAKLLRLARQKEKNMSGRLYWKRGVFYPNF